MQNVSRRGVAWLVAALSAAAVIGQPASSRAYSTGIPSTVFGPTGCPLCHTGGSTPTVILSGPTEVDPGATADYTLTIFGNPTQAYGGLNVAADDGVLSTGGPFAAGTQIISGLGGLAEITHTAPKQGDLMNIIEFSFSWTAPLAFGGTVHMRGWGNNVNHDLTSNGDMAALATLDIVSTAPSATPTASPTPGPDLCGDIAPLDPPLVSDGGSQLCQKAIAKAGALYAKKGLKAVQTCLKALQAGNVASDPLALCAGSAPAGVPPTDARAAAGLAKAEAKLRTLIAGKCDDQTVAALGLCDSTVLGVEDCLLAAHHQGIVDAVISEYGALQPTADPNAGRCQKAVGNSAARFLNTYLKASQKCLDARNKDGTAGFGAEQCIGSVSGGFVAPSDDKVAAALAKAAGKLSSKIIRSCTETDIANLAACANNETDLIACLTCAHRRVAFELLGAEYGGS